MVLEILELTYVLVDLCQRATMIIDLNNLLYLFFAMVIEPYCQQYPIIKAQKKRYSSNAVRAQHVINVPQYLSFSVVIGQLLK